jgi:hypothetical protein
MTTSTKPPYSGHRFPLSQFGEQRLKATLDGLISAPSPDIVAAIGDDLKHFTGEAPQTDSATALALRPVWG